MDIKSVADLAKIADLCRKKGIESIKITQDSVEFKLGEKPVSERRSSESKEEKIENDEALTEEELLMWSVTNQEVVN